MRSRRWRRGRVPLTHLIDAEINKQEAAGTPISTGSIVRGMILSVPLGVMMASFNGLLGVRVAARLKQRGYLITDDTTLERVVDVNVTNDEFDAQVGVKRAHILAVQRRFLADLDVQSYLHASAAMLGRSVTMGEFADEIDLIYAQHGFLN